MEHHGIPIDVEVFARLANPGAWRAVRDAMVPTIDAQYGVYVRNATGDWTFNMERFAGYLAREGIAWPQLETGNLTMRRKTFDEMSKGWPQLEGLRQLRHTRDKMRKIKLAVGADGRNRTVLWPFKSKTSRTQPKASEWIFSPAVWLRSLIKPEPGMAVSYIHYSAMEFLIAAVLSDGHCGSDNPMLDAYNSGDPYLSFAKRVGAAPRDATKKSHPEVRDRYKVVLLATQYGMEAETLAARAGVSEFEAQEMLSQHRDVFAQYWSWSDDWLQHAMQTGVMRTAMGWTCRTGVLELNERSIRNWPVQSTGADILRVACILATRHGIKLIAPVHDAVLIEAPIERIEADVALMREIMRRASRIVLNVSADGPHELRTDVKIVRYPERYSDPRGAEIWTEVLGGCWRRRAGGGRRRDAEGRIRQNAAMVGGRGGEGHQNASAPRLPLPASRLVEGEECDVSVAERVAGTARCEPEDQEPGALRPGGRWPDHSRAAEWQEPMRYAGGPVNAISNTGEPGGKRAR